MRLPVAALLVLALPGCLGVAPDRTQCKVDDGWGGTKAVFDPSGTCAGNPAFLPDWRDLEMEVAEDTLVVTSVYDAQGTHPRNWREFTLEATWSGFDRVRPALSVVLNEGAPLRLPADGLRMPAGPVQVGDSLRLCLEASFAKPERGPLHVSARVDHPRLHRTEWSIWTLHSCDGTRPDARELQFKAGDGALVLTGVRGGNGTGLSNWSDFVLRASNREGVRAALAGHAFQEVGSQGLVLPAQAMRVGDQLLLCLAPSNGRDGQGVVAEVRVDPVHDDGRTTMNRVWRIPPC